MDNIKAIISTMNNEDIREFRIFINRQKAKKQRKDLQLFEILLEETEYKPAVIIKKLYGKPNREAYHALRKRLIRHLTDFIVLKQMDNDTTNSSSIMGLLSLSRYMFSKGNERLAWHFLNKAEELGVNSEQFDILNNVYALMIEESISEHAAPIAEILDRQQENKVRVDEDERAMIANALIRHKLKEVRLSGATMDFDAIISDTYRQYGLSDQLHQRPKMLYSALSIARSAILAKKDFYSFEPFIIAEYDKIVAERGFSQSAHFYKLSFLYVIAHVLYRNKKFKEALGYTEKLGLALDEFGRSHYNLFYTRYVLLTAALKSFTGANDEAIQLLESLLSKGKKHLSTRDSLNAHLNLSVYYFQKEDYKTANQWLIRIHHTDRWMEKKMGKEWVFKKGLIEVILQYELGNEDIALNRIRSVERYFGDLFNSPAYQRARLFLTYVRSYIKDPLIVQKADFAEKVHRTLAVVDREQEDIQAMTFYAWLKSKIDGEKYYESLLGVVRADGVSA